MSYMRAYKGNNDSQYIKKRIVHFIKDEIMYTVTYFNH